MLWSREGLIGYLYGEGAVPVEEGGRPVARPISVSHLHGPAAFPAGLFANADHAELSAVIFSNACSISKLNRVMISAGADPNGLRYTRVGRFFDATLARLKAFRSASMWGALSTAGSGRRATSRGRPSSRCSTIRSRATRSRTSSCGGDALV